MNKKPTSNKILIIGAAGSGKTTMAQNLHQVTGLPVYDDIENFAEVPTESGIYVATFSSNIDYIYRHASSLTVIECTGNNRDNNFSAEWQFIPGTEPEPATEPEPTPHQQKKQERDWCVRWIAIRRTGEKHITRRFQIEDREEPGIRPGKLTERELRQIYGEIGEVLESLNELKQQPR